MGYPKPTKRTPLRPIHASRSCVTYGVVKELAIILRWLVGHSPTASEHTRFCRTNKKTRHVEMGMYCLLWCKSHVYICSRWGSYGLLWPTCPWKSLKTRPGTLPPTFRWNGKGMLMTYFPFKRQNMELNCYNTSTPLTLTYNSLQTTLTQMDVYPFEHPYHTWTRQHITRNSLQEIYIPTQTSTFTGTATQTFMLSTVSLISLPME